MLDQAIGDLLPAAAAVALSPIPIVAIVLVLASPHARSAGPAFAAGWVCGLTVVSVVVVSVVGGGPADGDATATGVSWLLAGLGVMFLVMAARQWAKRPAHGEEADVPSWMASIDSMRAAKAVVLGLTLSAANPKNLALTVAASAAIGQAGLDGADTTIAVAVFVALGSVTVVGAVLFALVAPRASVEPLAAIRQFMMDNNATIMMVVLVLLGAKLIGDALIG